MKLKEEFIDGEGTTFHVKRTYDAQPVLDEMGKIREIATNERGSDYKHVGRIPSWLLTEWLKEAGVTWDDTHAVNEIIKKKMLSGEFSALRNWEGRY